MKKVFDIVMFDLDGTLTNSGDGIINSLLYSLKQLEHDIPDKKILRKFIGPPIQKGLMEICGMTKEQSRLVSKIYRNHYEEISWRKNELYKGVDKLLYDLKNSDVFLTTATSRPRSSATRIIKYLKIFDYFDAIIAPEDHLPNIPKKELIETALGKYKQTYKTDKFSASMVGDTHFDIVGARQAKVTAIGVSYGYGTEEELVECKADMIASDVDQLRGYVLK